MINGHRISVSQLEQRCIDILSQATAVGMVSPWLTTAT